MLTGIPEMHWNSSLKTATPLSSKKSAVTQQSNANRRRPREKAHPVSFEECTERAFRLRRMRPQLPPWRCANRVEHGKAICKHSVTLLEATMRQYLKELLGEDYTTQDIRKRSDRLMVGTDGSLSPSFKQSADMRLCI